MVITNEEEVVVGGMRKTMNTREMILFK